MIRILSIDGGGIRGIVPAILLAEIERRTRQPIAKLFDLIVGTSTGGILALGFTVPNSTSEPKYEAEDLIQLYEENGKHIFARPYPFLRTVHRIRNVVTEKYNAGHLEKILQEYFQTTCLSAALKPVVVTSYEIERRVPFFFKSVWAQPQGRGANYDFPMWKVARATSAAPTYFKPFTIATDDLSDYYALVDGGVFANNPTLCAYAEAKWMRDDGLFPEEDDFLIVSLGTGELTRALYYDHTKGWGVGRWAQPILSVVFDGVADSVHYQMKQLLPDIPNPVSGKKVKRYYRFQSVLYEGNDDLDDASPKNIRLLKLLARNIIDTQGADLENLCGHLVSS
jgi:predicted acylesterase/phospholipase RssA